MQWLRELSAHALTDTIELLTDFLPNILGIPDKQSLELLCTYLYHPDSLVREYAMFGLTYWPRQEAKSAVREVVRTRGPSDVAVTFLIRRPGLLASDADAIAEGAIPYLGSDSPVLVRGAVTAIDRVALPKDSRVNQARPAPKPQWCKPRITSPA
jgi:hypothetical protein